MLLFKDGSHGEGMAEDKASNPGVTRNLKAKPLARGLATNQSQHMAKM